MRLGFTGQAGSGKDTAAQMAQAIMPSHPIYSLAGPIKDVFDKAFKWDERHRDGELKEVRLDRFMINPLDLVIHASRQYNVHPKVATKAVELFLDVIQMHNVHVTVYNGVTVAIENLSPRIAYQVWGTEVWRKIGGDTFWMDIAPDDCIIPDIRFDNEASICDVLFEIQGKNHRTGSKVNQHASEAGISEELIDLTVHNTGTLVELQEKVVDALYCYGVQDE
ncbi:P-loop containing nucleoside triphosphate hydrolase [Vibrio phage 1.204.O._10N.222.46.F12]|uniref:P-loop containing nucleoside triphosphate hydrolase n=1 Tax=Vibrio phage 1.204.O._10N.222.46.F12 TaxID=1881263 RepID=A0A2I7RNN5_9CAUD|nr:P-loop containing nucleoside triphosphate hydrolase [Vibrio phage 1.204.O._10N.222.46.F12]AUR95247.1 P-loop containing nucleoside triphosphate hydrolase [Vibrio phage 1.204.O._10N.222.46.F12]